MKKITFENQADTQEMEAIIDVAGARVAMAGLMNLIGNSKNFEELAHKKVKWLLQQFPTLDGFHATFIPTTHPVALEELKAVTNAEEACAQMKEMLDLLNSDFGKAFDRGANQQLKYLRDVFPATRIFYAQYKAADYKRYF